MPTQYQKHFQTKTTPQNQPIPGTNQVQNSAGGYVWKVNPWQLLDRFLILGTEGGSYYAAEFKLTREAATGVFNLIQQDGMKVVDRVVEISQQGRAAKNDPALFVLAMCAAANDKATRIHALKSLSDVARTGTHLLHFIEYVEGFRGWGKALRIAVGEWFLKRDPKNLAYQAIKYQQRDGWSLRDLLRLSHPKTDDPTYKAVFDWICKKEINEGWGGIIPSQIPAYHELQTLLNKADVAELIARERMPREAVPTQWLNEPEVWEALMQDMPLTAMIRNLGKMTNIGLLAPMNQMSIQVAQSLANKEWLKKSRVHPYALLLAYKTYQAGQGFRGNLTWTPVPEIIDALDDAFYNAFDFLEPTGKRHLLGIDVSGSMSWAINNGPISCAEGAACMAMATMRAEPMTYAHGFANTFRDLKITKKDTLDNVLRKTRISNFGGTDCAEPMKYAKDHKIEVDTFVVYTDNETWCGYKHPKQALDAYRQKTGIDAKLVVVGMMSNNFSIADPNDPGMLDVVGFDSSTPAAIAEFNRI